jgi:hypothetical protein
MKRKIINYKTMDDVHFRQSVSDFPLDVSLGGKVPAWGLSRWGGDVGTPCAGLLFRPDEDEGYTLSGGSKSLLYKGGKRSHRFTILLIFTKVLSHDILRA